MARREPLAPKALGRAARMKPRARRPARDNGPTASRGLGARPLRIVAILFAILWALGRADAWAQDSTSDDYESEVTAVAPAPPGPGDQPGFGQHLDLDAAPLGVSDVASVLDHSLGVRTRSLGGLGSF